MAIKKVTKDLVNLKINQAAVYLTITVGNYQIGASSVQFEDSPDPITKGKVLQFPLGAKEALSGKKLKIITTVLDSNTDTNNISVTIGFQGTTSEPIVIHDTVDNEGDYYALTTEYKFQ